MFIPQAQSNIIKAISILLIILGHNHILAPQDKNTLLFNFLYSFHVSIFFILPFFYNKTTKLNKKNISTIITRNGIPYLLFFVFCYFIYHFILIKNGLNLSEFFGGLINIPEYNLKSTTGFVFLWFLPVFLLMSLYKLIGSQYKWLMCIFFIIGFTFCINKQAYIFMWNAPFYLFKALYYYAMGLCTYFLFKYIKYMSYIGTAIFLILVVLFWTETYRANAFYFSITGFCAIKELTTQVDFSKCSLLKLIGKYSLSIYLTHVFIYNALERLLPQTFIWGIIIYFITIGISLLISFCIYRIEILRRFVFPKSWEEWISLFHKKRCIKEHQS